MTDFHRINEPRVEKMVAMFETILKSARSNRVGERELMELLAPLRSAIRQSSDLTTPPSMPGFDMSTPAPAPSMKEPKHIVLWKEAQTAPLDDLMMAWTTINARLADLVDEHKGT